MTLMIMMTRYPGAARMVAAVEQIVTLRDTTGPGAGSHRGVLSPMPLRGHRMPAEALTPRSDRFIPTPSR
jgi:hypothetical protein